MLSKRKSPYLVSSLLFGGLLVLGACVTINVYFPAAEAQEAAEEFVEKVLGEDEAAPPADANPQSSIAPQRARGFSVLDLLIAPAAAQGVDITIRTPAIQAIQDRMAARFQGGMQAHFDSGALGFGNDGRVVLRDAAKVALKDRVAVNQMVAEENRDRDAVYREIAVANGHPEWEQQIRETFAKQWVDSAHGGWWYQASDGAWKQK